MDDKRLEVVLQNAPDERRKLDEIINSTRDHSQQLGSVFVVELSYESAALAYPWPALDPPGIHLCHSESDLNVPYLYERELEDAMRERGLRVEEIGTSQSLYDFRFHLVFEDGVSSV